MKSRINLATRVYLDLHRVNLIMLSAALLLTSWIAFCVYDVTSNLEELKRMTSSDTGLASSAGKLQVSDNDYNKMISDVKVVNTILSRRSVDWLSLLDRLEMQVPDGVALKGLELEPNGSILKLTGSARGFATIRKLVEHMESSRYFTDVYLNNHANIKVGNDQKGIDFSITCKVKD